MSINSFVVYSTEKHRKAKEETEKGEKIPG
jgi:hypothetical protein